MPTTTPPTSPNPPQPVAPAPGRSFSELPLSPLLLATLAQLEYRSMTPIQAAQPAARAWPATDLIAQAKTGSGKTAAFALPLLTNLNPRRFAVQAMVLCPTRELAGPGNAGDPSPGTRHGQHQDPDTVRRQHATPAARQP